MSLLQNWSWTTKKASKLLAFACLIGGAWNIQAQTPVPVIKITANSYLKTWELQANATTQAEQANVWADFNNNGIQDEGETFTKNTTLKMPVEPGVLSISIYGNVIEFDAMLNRITSVDLSGNTMLQYANLSSNMLSSLILGSKPDMYGLDVSGNPFLESLDVTGLPKLLKLVTYKTKISTLDLSQNPLLTSLQCKKSGIETLDLSHNSNLFWLDCEENPLSSLDLSNNPKLTDLYLSACPIKELNLEKQTVLKKIKVPGCQLSSLVFNSSALEEVHVYNNQIKMLDMSKLVHSLTDRMSKDTQGVIYVINSTSNTEQNEFIKAFSAVTDGLNWVAYDLQDWANGGTNWCTGSENPTAHVTVSLSDVAPFAMELALPAGESVILDHGLAYLDRCAESKSIDMTPKGKELHVYGTALTLLSIDKAKVQTVNFLPDLNINYLVVRESGMESIDLLPLLKLQRVDLSRNALAALDLSGLGQLLEVNVSYNNLSAEQLDALMVALPDVNGVSVAAGEEWKKKLYVQGNPGAELCNIKPAVDKGWIVQTETAISAPVTETALYFDYATATLRAALPLQQIQVYSVNGVLVDMNRGETTGHYSLTQLNAGTYLVHALDQAGRWHTLKIVR